VALEVLKITQLFVKHTSFIEPVGSLLRLHRKQLLAITSQINPFDTLVMLFI